MTALALLQQLQECGVVLTPSPDGTLRYRAPKGMLTPALLDRMRQHKQELLDLVEAFEERAAIMEYCSGLSRPEAEQLAWRVVLGEETPSCRPGPPAREQDRRINGPQVDATPLPRQQKGHYAGLSLDEQDWTPFERERRRWVEDLGLPTLANHYRDPHLLQWARFAGKHVYIGRGSRWGNPFEVGKDGDREFVLESFAQYYLPRKLSVLKDLEAELDGKVLECFCLPDVCHGGILLKALPCYCPGRGLTPWQLLDAYMVHTGLRAIADTSTPFPSCHPDKLWQHAAPRSR